MASMIVATLALLATITSGAAIPSNCTATYEVQPDDTCTIIVNKFSNFTAPDLYAWNPTIGVTCNGLYAYAPVCINVPGYTYQGPIQGGAIFTAGENPVPRMPEIISGCTKFAFMDASGQPSLSKIWTDNRVTKSQWNSWNWPSLDPSRDLYAWVGYFSCVGIQ